MSFLLIVCVCVCVRARARARVCVCVCVCAVLCSSERGINEQFGQMKLERIFTFLALLVILRSQYKLHCREYINGIPVTTDSCCLPGMKAVKRKLVVHNTN